ncbi:adenylosuccinate synthetase [Candidatus Pacearchaeota archaeon]|nr:adenylosuccinate synthetase [Candidatus Pacearchaeota archaeon]
MKPLIQIGKANILIGGQWGSEGKGKLAGWLYRKFPEISVVASDFTPNAGHTYVDDVGKAYVSKVIPLGLLFPTVKVILIGPHSVFDLERFNEEEQSLRRIGSNATIFIHPMASVLTIGNVAAEARGLRHIASTLQGSAEAAIGKIRRNPSDTNSVRLAKDEPTLRHMIRDTQELMQTHLDLGDTVLIETAQGYDLGLNHGHTWPYVTGRDVMLGRIMDSAGVHPSQLGSVIAALRTFPIRVGDLPEGTSGKCHGDQVELTWEAISNGIGRETIEYTTVTKRVRRVFTWSDKQVQRMCSFIKPDHAFLNYVNYLPEETMTAEVKRISTLLRRERCELSLLGTGTKNCEMTTVPEFTATRMPIDEERKAGCKTSGQ